MSRNIDLLSMSRKDLEELRKDVDNALVTLAETNRKAALENARRAAAEHGFTLEELAGLTSSGKGQKRTKTSRPVKFRDPEDPTNVWSGRGRRPFWMQKRLDAGQKMEDMAV